MRHTKIIATVGPASAASEALEALMVAGVDIFRLNFSHGTHDSHRVVYGRIRDGAARRACHVAILQDLGGPKIRTGPLTDGAPLTLSAGEELRIAAGNVPGSRQRIYTPFAPLVTSAKPGDRLLLDDGRIELRVVSASATELVTVVVSGGMLAEKKGINAPGVGLPSLAVTAKDEADLRFGLTLGVDLVALSFVQTADDVKHAIEIMALAGCRIPVIAKIERPAAVENLDAILQIADGVMVARGDLGLEMPLEQVPRVQKEIIRKARSRGRPVIVATQVLESMRVDPRPTRAEVSDAAGAVDQGADAIMLAGETAVGAHPVRAVETLSAVIRDAETVPFAERLVPAVDPTGSLHARALCEAAVTLASAGQADAIVAVTRQGKTARLLSSLRPPCAILAATDRADVAGALTMYWGVTPFVTAEFNAGQLERLVIVNRLVKPDDVVVFINVNPDLKRADANFLNVQKLG
jgi:pyruvate kinase